MKRNKEYIKSSFTILSNIIPGVALYSSKKIILPAYHVVSDIPVPHIENLYKVKGIKEFEKDLDYLLKHFNPIDLQTLKELTSSQNKVTKSLFHLSFDDGLRECNDIILPILKRKGIPATFFINPSFINNEDLMHRYKVSLIINDLKNSPKKKEIITRFIKKKLGIRRDPSNFLLTLRYSHRRILNEIALLTETDFSNYLLQQQPYLNDEEIKKIIKDGYTIGAHSMDHPEYFMLSEEEQLRQTIDSIEHITKRFNLNYKVFAFPFTDHQVSKSFFNNILDTNNPRADLTFGVAGIKKDISPFQLQRIPMEKTFSGKEIIKGEYLYYYFKALFNSNRITRI